MTTQTHDPADHPLDELSTWRWETPGTRWCMHFNNAGASLMPEPVLRAVTEHLGLESTGGGYETAQQRDAEIQSTYAAIGQLIGARERIIAIVPNATTGFVQALSTVDLQPGDVLVTSRADYVSNQIQYLALARRRGVRVVFAVDLPDRGVDANAVREAVACAGRRCRLVALSWVPTNSGLVQDVASVGAAIEDTGVPFLVDACQAVGQIPVRVDALRCDYLTATARKFLRGPRGVGFMYVADRALARGDYPVYIDMRGARRSGPNACCIADSARRFEDWEFPYALVLGQARAVDYALQVGVSKARARAWALAARLREGCAGVPGVRVLDRGPVLCAIVTVAVAAMSAARVVDALRARHINGSIVRREHAQFDFAEKNAMDAVRFSPHYYNTEDEVDAVVEAMASIVVEK